MPARPALLYVLLATAGLLVGAGPSAASPVDGFKHGLPAGVDAGGIVVGFYAFQDDVSGWRRVSVSFADLTRKDIGNGAPDDGLGLNEVHGWALGTLATDGPATYHVDDVRLVASIPEPATLALFGAGLLMTLRAARRQPR